MRRREFVPGLGALMWPLTSFAQHAPTPTIGFLRNTGRDEAAKSVDAFRKGLAETGYVEGRNLNVEYRWTAGHTDRLPGMALNLVEHRVNVIVALGNTPAVLAARAATSTIPIVFALGQNPVEMGLVASLNRPGGNLTGIVNLNQQVARKWVEVMHELVPRAVTLGLLVNPANAPATSNYIREVDLAARPLGLKVHVLHAKSAGDFDDAFGRVRQFGAAGVAIVADVLFISHVEQLAATALRHGLPAMYPFREFAAAGGLASYGTDLLEVYRLAGVHTGRILRGEQPAELPVQQATKLEFIINLRTARALGIEVATSLLARADEVID